MVPREQDHPLIVSKVKYLGSCLLPCPLEHEATIGLYHDMMQISELDVKIPFDKIFEIELASGRDLPSQTVMMFRVVGLLVEKDKPYMTIRLINSSDSLLFKFENVIIAYEMMRQIKAAKNL